MFSGKVIERGTAFRKKILGLLQISRLQGRGFLRRVKKERGLINSRDATLYFFSTPHFFSKNLEMRFPETTLRSHADFKRWYAGIGQTIASNTHTLESVKMSVLGGGDTRWILWVFGRPSPRRGNMLFQVPPAMDPGGWLRQAAADSDLSRGSGELEKIGAASPGARPLLLPR